MPLAHEGHFRAIAIVAAYRLVCLILVLKLVIVD